MGVGTATHKRKEKSDATAHSRWPVRYHFGPLILGVRSFVCALPVAARAQYIVKPVAEMKINQLPKGELYWRVEKSPDVPGSTTPVHLRFGSET